MAQAVASEHNLLQWVQALVPRIAWTGRHKGSMGRLAVVGGSRKYTGAPYFAGVSALRTGADLCSVLCVPGAATAIKSFHPDLMVDPILDADASCDSHERNEDTQADRCYEAIREEHLGRLSALICGPVGCLLSLCHHTSWSAHPSPVHLPGHTGCLPWATTETAFVVVLL